MSPLEGPGGGSGSGVNNSLIGAANGIAPLGPDKIVPGVNLPASVADAPGLRPDGALGETFPIWAWGNPTAGPSLITGNLRVCRADDVAPAGQAITSITVISVSGADAAGQTHLWFVLYRASDRALLAVTGDDLATGWVGGTAKQLNLSAPYTPAADFVPVIGIVQVATTPSKLITAGAIASNALPDSLSALFSGASVGGNSQNTGLAVPGDAPATYTAPAAGGLRSPFYAFWS